MNSPRFLLAALSLGALCIYLFVTAPAPLPEAGGGGRSSVPIEHVLATVAAENDVARMLYTREIVGAGLKAGLKFDELWRNHDLDAGPLPALFLREAAQSIQRSGSKLGLFLGSDFPISAANKFTGKQAEIFQAVKSSRQPRFFYAEDVRQHTAMFPDYSSVQACVTCHNEHPQSPKKDWTLEDVMGATTWMYPEKAVSSDEFAAIVKATRGGFRAAYLAYVEKVKTFQGTKPEVGNRWPRDGKFVPTLEVFLAEFESRASAATVRRLIELPTTPAK